MLPREYFNDKITMGIAKGARQFVKRNRFTILKLPFGYGKTIISMLVATYFANQKEAKEIQMMIIAPKAKRLDNSFTEAIESVETYFNIKITILPINGETIGTFAGFKKMANEKELYSLFKAQILEKPTILILDETHLEVKNATSKSSKVLKNLMKEIEKKGGNLRILGLTATPFDKSILDIPGYLVLNGDYNSRTDFFKKEVRGYLNAYRRGLSSQDVENQIINEQYRIDKGMFLNLRSVLQKFNNIMYAPIVPRNFHLPKNEFKKVEVEISEKGKKNLEFIELMKQQGAYPDTATKRSDYIGNLTRDVNVLKIIVQLCEDAENNQPLIFYNRNTTLESIKKVFESRGLKYFEVNGHIQSFFKENDKKSPVLVQYKSGAYALESKDSNCSIYLDMPLSSVSYEQSLGRNVRRNQNVDIVTNYMITPIQGKNKKISWVEDDYNRIVNKTIWNKKFEKTFESKWGSYGEDEI